MQEKAEGLNAKQEDTHNIVANSLWDYLQQIQSAVQKGYVLSDKNACFPQAYISLYTVTLVKEPVAEVDTVVVEDTTVIPQKIDASAVRQNQTNLGRKKVK